MSYRVFVRNWWREAQKGESGWPNGLVPNSGDRGRTIGRAETEVLCWWLFNGCF